MDFYVLLGVERSASPNDIRRAYKRLARRCHPDINPGDHIAVEQFRQIAEAYETLSDAARRRQYDTAGPSGPAAEHATFGFEGFDFSVSVSGESAPTFGDLFADVLHRGARRRDGEPERGSDLYQSLALSFEEAVRGGQWSMAVTRQVYCRTCRGAGHLPTTEGRCGVCSGSGFVKSARGHMVFSKPCPQCRGSGRQAEGRCTTCGGDQMETRTEPLIIQVPPGLADRARVRVPGKGYAGRNGGGAGDLYVTILVEPHPLFRREGGDLHMVIPIAIHEAALGAKMDVPSLDGHTRLRVPPGTQSGQRFRLRERGVRSVRGQRRGDLVVEVRLVLPRLLDERSKELVREFGRINGEDVRRDLNRS